MKKIFNLLAIVALLACVYSCETYKVKDPAMSAISNVDGKYMAFATPDGEANPTTVFGIVITNTTDDSSDGGWITITDLDYATTPNWQRLFAVRFHIDINTKDQTFKAASVDVTEPRTAWNPYIEGAYGSYGSYYTASYQWGNMGTSTASIEGKVVKDGIKTPSGYTADTIEFTYTLTYTDGTSESYSVKGQKKTGWAEDAMEYEEWLADKGWWE